MRFKKNQSFWTSVIIHLVVLFGLFLATIIEAFKPKEEEHVFVMVDPGPISENPVQAVQPQPIPEPQPQLPELPSLQAIPELPEPAPVKPTPPAPTPVKPQPQNTEPAKPKTMSFEDYQKEFGKPEPKVRQQPTQTVRPPDVTIDPRKFQINPDRIRTPQTTTDQRQASSSQLKDELQAYNQRLSAALDRAWMKPNHLAGRFEVTVVFYVSASGRITNVKLNPSSGNSTFDQSVIAAFQRVGGIGPTPTREAHSFTKRFLLQ